jgi:hypothetical protein
MAKKINVLTEAVVNYELTLLKHREILREALAHKCFKDVKRQFDSKEEVLLYESLWQRPPETGMLSSRPMVTGPGMYGEATKPLGKLKAALKSANMDSFESINELAEDLENVLSAADDVIPLLNAEEPVVRKEAKILIAKLYFVLSNMFKLVTEKTRELRLKLPTDFNPEEVRTVMKNANVARRLSDSELDSEIAEKESQKKKGFFRGLMDKLKGQ